MKTYNHYKILPIINHLIINAMRKSLLLFLVAMVMPVLSFAQTNDNKAISKTARTSMSNSSTTESRGYVDGGVLGYQKAGSTMTGSYTVSAWVNYSGTVTISGTSYNSVIFGYGGRMHCNDNGQWNLVADKNGYLTFAGWGIQDITSTSTAMPSGEWAYLTVTYDATDGSLKGYLNGAEVVTATAKSNAFEDFSNESPALYFGAWCFGGSFDELQCWQKALTADEIAAAKTNAQAVSGMTGLYTFDEVKSGSTAQFENKAIGGNDSFVAYWGNAIGAVLWDNGVAYVLEDAPSWAGGASCGGESEVAPTLGEGREIVAAEATVTLTQTTGGTLTVKNGDATLSDGANTVSGGSTLTFEATPEAGYALQGIDVTVGDVTVRYAADASYVVVADATITPVWSNTLYALTVVKDDDVTIAVTRSGAEVTDLTSLFGGEDYKVAVTVPNEKKLVSVKLGETVLTADADGLYTVNLTEAATLTIETVAKAQYTVTINQVDGGTITVTDADGNTITSGATVLEGTVLTLSATSATGYQFKGYTVNGTTSGATVTVTANVTISATFEEGIEYCEPTPIAGRQYTDGTTHNTARYITTLTAKTSDENSISISGPGAVVHQVYLDHSDQILTVDPGDQVTVSIAGGGSWMNTFIYADFDSNGLDSGDEVHKHYVPNSPGASVVGDYSFSVPENLAPGSYRVRYMLNWDENQGPCEYGQAYVSATTANDNGEHIIDFTLYVAPQILDHERTVTVASADEEMGTVAITSPATAESSVTTNEKTVVINATAATGASFMNWTDAAGNVVSTDATYTYTGTEDASFTANFGYTVTFEAAPADGTIVVKYNGSAITSGTVVPAGAELTIEATPVSDKMLVGLTANGTSIISDMSCIVDAATTIVATFGDMIITAELNYTGNGTVIMTTGQKRVNRVRQPDMDTQIQPGDAITTRVYYWITPADGEEVVSVVAEGSSTLDTDPQTLTMDDLDNGILNSADGNGGTPYYILLQPADGVSQVSLTVTFSTNSTAIDGIEADDENAPVEYFNLQGIRVNSQNLTPGVYVRRQGSKTTKVLVTVK